MVQHSCKSAAGEQAVPRLPVDALKDEEENQSFIRSKKSKNSEICD